MRAAAPFYLHPAAHPLEWEALRAGRLGLEWAVVNVHDGPGERYDPHYYGPALALPSRTPLCGYVDLAHGHRDPAVVRREALAWRDWYGLDALMLDSAPARPRDAAAVTQLVEALREAGFGMVVLNPGVPGDPAIEACGDVVCTVEVGWDTYRRLRPAPARGWHLVHSVPPGELHAAAALVRSSGADLAWVTDAVLPNPWGRLPHGWAAA